MPEQTAACGVTLGADIPHFSAPLAAALDMDRTLIYTNHCVDRLLGAATVLGIDVEPVRIAQQKIEADGGSFDPLRLIEAQLTEEAFTAVGDAFLRKDPTAITYPDTPQLYDRLWSPPESPHLILTFGANSLWQAMKAAASGTHGYVEIMPHSDKGPQIANWRGPTGSFDFIGIAEDGTPLAVYHTASVELTDDKINSFKNLPADCRGAHLVRPGETRLPSQQGILPETLRQRMRTIAGLGEVTVPELIEPADCSKVSAADIPALAGFRPAYSLREPNPGLLITPGISFAALRTALSSVQRV